MKTSLIASACALALFVPCQASAQATAGTFAGSMAVSSIIQDLRNAVAGLIVNADDAVSANTFRTRQHLEILSGQINLMAQGTIDKTFGQLTAAEQQAFKDVGNQIYKLQSLEHASADDVKSVTYAVASSLDKLPFVKGTPMVMEYGPLYVVGRNPADRSSVAVSIRGTSLGTGIATYTIGGKPCQRTAQITTAITFSCPAALFAASAAPTPVVGELTVPRTLTWWENVKAWFGNVPPPQRYTLGINAIPTRLGGYSVKAIVSTQTVETADRSQDFKDGNDHCQGGRRVTFQFNATPDWSIYTNSIKPQCDSSTSSRCLGLQNVADKSFIYLAQIANHGGCGPFWKDARGTVWGNVAWREYRTHDGTAEQQVGTGDLSWGKAVQIKLPDNTRSVSISVQQIDGRTPIVINGDVRSPWFETEYQKDAQIIVIRPKNLDEALKS